MEEIKNSPEEIEIRLLTEAIYQKYGYDFRNYGRAHIRRRILNRLALSHLSSVSEMTHKLLYDENFFNKILLDLSINVTEMFRDPDFYSSLRKELIPLLKTYPFIKIWHAGCATGEEVYSMAILLQEEGLLKRAQLYATDFNQLVLKKAKEAIFPADKMKEYNRNYKEAGGKKQFSAYYTASYESVKLNDDLKNNIVFADHNLVTDGVFGEMNLIICRNVLIYFNKDLQNKVIKLFYDSLQEGGFLCLGSRESLRFTKYAGKFETIDANQRIFTKKY
jgi:chemotaxis protein methyltransferase CheR